jgi:tRNA pseudouridine55 synthase
MDGLLVIDKPTGPTSHDVVDRARRLLGERRIGHTGTLDPAASGVLPLVLGRATRLARFLSASDKSYVATIRLGFATDTQDAQGTPSGGRHHGPWPSHEAVERALDSFRGTFLQQPPAHSAKKVAGKRSYRAAHRARRDGSSPLAIPVLPAPVSVTATALELLAVERDVVRLTIDCSAGFYVRALAHALGETLGVGAHLAALRRVRCGDVTLSSAVTLEALEREPAQVTAAVVPLSRMLPQLTSVRLTGDGVRHAVHGRDLGPGDILGGNEGRSSLSSGPDSMATVGGVFVRLIDPAGDLVAIGESIGASGLLHPAVVLV